MWCAQREIRNKKATDLILLVMEMCPVFCISCYWNKEGSVTTETLLMLNIKQGWWWWNLIFAVSAFTSHSHFITNTWDITESWQFISFAMWLIVFPRHLWTDSQHIIHSIIPLSSSSGGSFPSVWLQPLSQTPIMLKIEQPYSNF